jgi:phospholipid/cholesterol/gamma-HCH transport system substrate-binding protein
MKLAIRFADKIIGALVILALGILVFVIIMLGSSQRWFARDYQYKAYFNSAAGLSTNMPVLYKGFTIGRIKTIKLLDNDAVEVGFTIFDSYYDRVREGSLVEILRNPIGLGNQFLFSPGKGLNQVPEGGTIPTVNSEEGKRLIDMALSERPEGEDSIGNIVNTVATVLADLQEAVKGSDQTSLGRTFGGVETTVTGLSAIPAEIEQTLNMINSQLKPILSQLDDLTKALSKPEGTVMSILDSEGPVYKDLVKTLDGIAGTVQNLEKTIGFIPSQIPQLTVIISDVNVMLNTIQDLLISLTNNPILKGGIPEHKETQAGGTRPRDIEF